MSHDAPPREQFRDPAFGKVLTALREYFLAHVAEMLELLQQEQAEAEESLGKPDKPAPKTRRRARR